MKLKKMIDKTLALYLLVGVLNFIVCTGIMFLLIMWPTSASTLRRS